MSRDQELVGVTCELISETRVLLQGGGVVSSWRVLLKMRSKIRSAHQFGMLLPRAVPWWQHHVGEGWHDGMFLCLCHYCQSVKLLSWNFHNCPVIVPLNFGPKNLDHWNKKAAQVCWCYLMNVNTVCKAWFVVAWHFWATMPLRHSGNVSLNKVTAHWVLVMLCNLLIKTLTWRCVLMKDSIVKKSGKVSIMMKNLKKSGSHKAEEARKYEAEKSRVVVTWPSVAMYLRASRTPLIIILFLCHMLRTSVMVTADFWLAAWSVDVPQDFASANSTVRESMLFLSTWIKTKE